MPFWGSLISEGTRIAGWLARNSGSVENALKAVARITGKVVAAEGQTFEDALRLRMEADGGNAFPSLVEYLGEAEAKLQAEADNALQRQDTGSGFETEAIQKPIQMSAFWPTPDIRPGKSIPSVSGDINKFLAANNVPTVYRKDGKPTDLGDYIAQQMFQKKEQKQGINVKEIPFVQIGNGKVLAGAYAYYAVPLGNKGHDGWHGHLRLDILRNNSGGEMNVEEQFSRPINLQPSLGSHADIKPYNTTTIEATFSGVSNTAEYMYAVIQRLQSRGVVSISQYPVIAGPVYLYQLETTLEIGPAQVLSEFATAAGDAMQGYADKLPAMPELKVVNNQLYV